VRHGEKSIPDANFQTGGTGLIAIDKLGNQVLFLDPRSLATTLTIDGFAPRGYELAISPDQATAFQSTATASTARTPIRIICSRYSASRCGAMPGLQHLPLSGAARAALRPARAALVRPRESGVVLEMDAQKH
jgi:hypothetical protein